MITKLVVPIIADRGCSLSQNPNSAPIIGTRITYRIFGLKLYEKVIRTPIYYGYASWQSYIIQF
jgi:hypothetical protein